MTTIAHILDHAERAQGLLPGQFDSSTNLRNLVAQIVGIEATDEDWDAFIIEWLETEGAIGCDVAPADAIAVQELEDVLWSIMSTQWLDVATGDQLDVIGIIVGLGRTNASDGEYRTDLYTEIMIHSSQGDPEQLISIAKRVSGAGMIHFKTLNPGVALIYCHELVDLTRLQNVQRAATGGIRVMIVGSEDDDVFVFGRDMDSGGVEHGLELPYGLGFAEYYAAGEEIVGGGSIAEWFEE